MATILKGAPVVAAMNERNAALCEQLKAKGITPTLAVVRVGEREDDLSYERGVIARCGKVGVEVKQFLLPADASQDDLLKVMLDRENATVTICNSRTQNLPAICKEADVVVVAMGKMGAVGADCLREGQIVVDVGIHVNEKGKLCGDVKFSEAEPVVDAITPVPGGVGTVTTSVLVGHVVQAAAKKAGL